LFIRALDLWEQHPVLEFSDAVIAARCERGGHELATFDGHFDRVASVRKWSPGAHDPPVSPT
jgi:predicted nucleic acid-binding protein